MGEEKGKSQYQMILYEGYGCGAYIEIERQRERTELVQDSAYRWSSHRQKGATSHIHIWSTVHILGYIARLSQFGGRVFFSCLWCYYLPSRRCGVQPSNSHDSKKARSALQ